MGVVLSAEVDVDAGTGSRTRSKPLGGVGEHDEGSQLQLPPLRPEVARDGPADPVTGCEIHLHGEHRERLGHVTGDSLGSALALHVVVLHRDGFEGLAGVVRRWLEPLLLVRAGDLLQVDLPVGDVEDVKVASRHGVTVVCHQDHAGRAWGAIQVVGR